MFGTYVDPASVADSCPLGLGEKVRSKRDSTHVYWDFDRAKYRSKDHPAKLDQGAVFPAILRCSPTNAPRHPA